MEKNNPKKDFDIAFEILEKNGIHEDIDIVFEKEERDEESYTIKLFRIIDSYLDNKILEADLLPEIKNKLGISTEVAQSILNELKTTSLLKKTLEKNITPKKIKNVQIEQKKENIINTGPDKYRESI